jgi:hypothetical protein
MIQKKEARKRAVGKNSRKENRGNKRNKHRM